MINENKAFPSTNNVPSSMEKCYTLRFWHYDYFRFTKKWKKS